jgi:hypothetical protein
MSWEARLEEKGAQLVIASAAKQSIYLGAEAGIASAFAL